ncbi:MAG TPA: hypothetical protein VGE52_06355, partial [Pirellulales bacterium]
MDEAPSLSPRLDPVAARATADESVADGSDAAGGLAFPAAAALDAALGKAALDESRVRATFSAGASTCGPITRFGSLPDDAAICEIVGASLAACVSPAGVARPIFVGCDEAAMFGSPPPAAEAPRERPSVGATSAGGPRSTGPTPAAACIAATGASEAAALRAALEAASLGAGVRLAVASGAGAEVGADAASVVSALVTLRRVTATLLGAAAASGAAVRLDERAAAVEAVAAVDGAFGSSLLKFLAGAAPPAPGCDRATA